MVGVHAAAVTFDLHVPESRSLKAKRSVVRPIVDGLRHRFHLSVAETGHLDQWQRAEIGVAIVAASDDRVLEILTTVERFVAGAEGAELLGTEIAWLDPDGVLDGGVLDVEVGS
jgi:uncharacterized protein YlxP (DUF503 family)